MVQITEIQELLQSFVTDTLDLRGAILTSNEGLYLASAFVEVDNIDKQKEIAITANFLDLIKQFKKDLTLGVVEKIIIEGREGYCVLVSCDNNIILLVLANKEIVKGWLFLEIKRLVKKINNQ